MVVDELDKLVAQTTECRTLAFADLSTKMILVADTGSHLPREALDRLCTQAASLLGVNGKQVLGEQSGRTALAADTKDVHLFLRAEDEPDDVLCCVCTPEVDIEKFVADATACLHRISTGHA